MSRPVIFVFLSLILFSCASNRTSYYSLNSDQYWSELLNESQKNHQSIMNILKKKNVALYQQIVTDSKDELLKDLWGKSLNFDSGAKKQIVSDEVLSALLEQFKERPIEKDKLIVPAGIVHTYGYLFSDLITPYGYKRERWIRPTLNFAFDLSGNDLSPFSEKGGLLSNVTYFAGMLSFKNKEDKDRLKQLKNVSDEIKTFNYYDLTLEHLEEEIPGHVLRTSLLMLPKKDVKEENDYLLIYSLFYQAEKKERLISMFPIKLDAYKKIVDPKALGERGPIALRYNAYLDLKGPWTGKRFLWKETR